MPDDSIFFLPGRIDKKCAPGWLPLPVKRSRVGQCNRSVVVAPDAPPVRRRIAAFALLCLVLGSGCLTLGPTVSTPDSESAVFGDVTTQEPWASRSIRASVTLSPEATTAHGVTRLAVIDERGSTFDTAKLESGQTSVTVYLPSNQNATLVATNTVNGTVVARQSTSTGGDTIL